MRGGEAEPAIALYELSRRFGPQYVLNNINLFVARGRTVLLRGSNGAGKTTLLRVIATRLRPTRGRGAVFGFDLVKQGGEVRRRAAYLPVFGGAYPSLSGFENLQISARLFGLAPSATQLEGLLEAVSLHRQRHQLVRTFSSGMKKRLGLARLQLSPAELWLLDEPYAALDEDGRELVDLLLDHARAQHKTIVVASHEETARLAAADAVLELDQGALRATRRASKEALEALM